MFIEIGLRWRRCSELVGVGLVSSVLGVCLGSFLCFCEVAACWCCFCFTVLELLLFWCLLLFVCAAVLV